MVLEGCTARRQVVTRRAISSFVAVDVVVVKSERIVGRDAEGLSLSSASSPESSAETRMGWLVRSWRVSCRPATWTCSRVMVV